MPRAEPAITFTVITPRDEHGFYRVRVECPGGSNGQIQLKDAQVNALVTIFKRGNRQGIRGAVEFE